MTWPNTPPSIEIINPNPTRQICMNTDSVFLLLSFQTKQWIDKYSKNRLNSCDPKFNSTAFGIR